MKVVLSNDVRQRRRGSRPTERGASERAVEEKRITSHLITSHQNQPEESGLSKKTWHRSVWADLLHIKTADGRESLLRVWRMDKHKGKWNDNMKFIARSLFAWCHVSYLNFKRLRCFPILNIWDNGSWETGGYSSPEGCNRRKLSFQGKLTFQCARSLISPSLCVSHSSSLLVYDFWMQK